MNRGFPVSPERSLDAAMGRGFMSRGWMGRGIDGLLVESSVGAAVLGNQDNCNRAQDNSYI